MALVSCAVRPLAAQTPVPPAPGMRTLPDLPYVSGGTDRQKLDLYLPAVTPGAPARPLVVWVHGGGWESGDRRGVKAKDLVAHGVAVASVGYRLSQTAKFPAQIEDVKAAVRWLRAHAGEYGIDPAHVAAWGLSAGGHLVALLGTTGHTRQFDVGENLDQSSAVQCVVDWFGPSDFFHWGDPEAPAAFFDLTDDPIARLLGGSINTRRELTRAANPVDWVDKDSAPFLIMHGDRDTTVPLQQSRELDAALHKAGVESTLIVVSGAGHGGPGFTSPENIAQIGAFLFRHLAPGS